ncbi:sigma factor-binding protein Crl [Vibrio ostreicida]|uniref:Sigma factor-binding protein Crl n=1 Tax=Vibrio ostreicida TaxID=526588 RepID=A0ABT8BS06_9VIBR|nr:sigma factor-binding protein Crl [Vibrio ostreicida]MDN3609229.1 sigma factor-binding protein Crl [Vibrio ostreicida]NPD08120.1 sigma factor-binding protein Crl [Vibrio ostreicida]
MSEQSKSPTHYRLLSTLKAIGPYLREVQCEEGRYLFDCLSVCVSDKKSPEEREFWGWWLELEIEGKKLAARYRTGLYDVKGDWLDEKLPKKAIEEVSRTQEAFHQKLVDTLQSQFGMTVHLHKESAEFV